MLNLVDNEILILVKCFIYIYIYIYVCVCARARACVCVCHILFIVITLAQPISDLSHFMTLCTESMFISFEGDLDDCYGREFNYFTF